MLIKFIKKILLAYTVDKNVRYKIEQINEVENRVVVSCRGKGAAIISTIEDIGEDEFIISFLPAHHACWLGYYYGKKWSQNKIGRAHINFSKVINSSNPKQIFKIVGQNRSGEVLYRNTLNDVSYQESPINLAKSNEITNFDAVQAFYVGFLAAIKAKKDADKSNKMRPHLRVVK